MTSMQHQVPTAAVAGDPPRRAATGGRELWVDDESAESAAPPTTLPAPWYSILGATPEWRNQPTPNIADQFADLLEPLDDRKRRGMISWIAVRFYDGWRPSRREIADLVAVEIGTLSLTDCIERQRQRQLRRIGRSVITDITALPRSGTDTAAFADHRLGHPRRTARWGH